MFDAIESDSSFNHKLKKHPKETFKIMSLETVNPRDYKKILDHPAHRSGYEQALESPYNFLITADTSVEPSNSSEAYMDYETFVSFCGRLCLSNLINLNPAPFLDD